MKESGSEPAEGLTKVKEILQKNNVKILNEDVWGSRELAYPIKKEKKGYYVFLILECEASAIKNIDRLLKLNEHILRFMFFKKEKI